LFFKIFADLFKNNQDNQDNQVQNSKQDKQKEILCALVIGHKKHSPGARNLRENITEFEFNEQLAIDIENNIQNITEFKNLSIQRVYRRTYKSLPADINKLNPDFIISMHCNAFNGKAKGCEVLYYYKSSYGKKFANILNLYFSKISSKSRGIKPINVEDRGGYLLKYTKAPCIIAEPFFIDNDDELNYYSDNYDLLLEAYIDGILDIAEILKEG